MRLFSWRPGSIGCARIPTYASSFAPCVLALLVPGLGVGQPRDVGAIQPQTNANLAPFAFPAAGLLVNAEGGARVDSECRKPHHHDRQRTDSPTALLTTQWSDDCSYKGSTSGASLQGEAGYNRILATASGFYAYTDNHLAAFDTSVVATMTDLLQFDIVGTAKSNCGLTKNIDPTNHNSPLVPVSATCIQVKFAAIWDMYDPLFDGNAAAFSSAQFTIGPLRHYPTAFAVVCNAFDLCHGGPKKWDGTLTVIIGTDPGTHQRIPFPITMTAQATVIGGAMGRSIGSSGSNYFLAGVHDFKVCVDPLDGPAVRVTSKSGTDYSNAANHCY